MKLSHILSATFVTAAITCAVSFVSCSKSGDSIIDEPDTPETPEKPDTPVETGPKYLVLAYVWQGAEMMPDVSSINGVIYSGNEPNPATYGLKVMNPDRLKKMVDLKKQKKDLKVILSLGGASKVGWDVVSANESNRKAFARACKRVIDQYDLDGLDFDWEIPGGYDNSAPIEVENFPKLIKEVRAAIGNDKTISIATGNTGGGMKIDQLVDNIDWFNLMTYDMHWTGNKHHTALYNSLLAPEHTVDRAVAYFADRNVPYSKIVVGLAFYGHGFNNVFGDYTDYRDIVQKPGVTFMWDNLACVPYAVDADGNFVLGYDNPESLTLKCDYVKKKGIRGAMYWRAECDNDSYELAKTVGKCLITEADK